MSLLSLFRAFFFFFVAFDVQWMWARRGVRGHAAFTAVKRIRLVTRLMQAFVTPLQCSRCCRHRRILCLQVRNWPLDQSPLPHYNHHLACFAGAFFPAKPPKPLDTFAREDRARTCLMCVVYVPCVRTPRFLMTRTCLLLRIHCGALPPMRRDAARGGWGLQ